MGRPIRLLAPEALLPTSELDQGEWSHRRGPLGWVIRHRYRMVTDLLDDAPAGATPSATAPPGRPASQTVLEIGYAGGIFIPELARRFDRVVGVDVHPHADEVMAALGARGIVAELHEADAAALPLPDASVDVIVALSVLEFIDDLDAVATECARVLVPGGRLIVVTPGESRLLDLGLKVLSGTRAEDTFQGRRGRILPALSRRLALTAVVEFPRVTSRIPGVPAAYTAATFSRRPELPAVIDLRDPAHRDAAAG